MGVICVCVPEYQISCKRDNKENRQSSGKLPNVVIVNSCNSSHQVIFHQTTMRHSNSAQRLYSMFWVVPLQWRFLQKILLNMNSVTLPLLQYSLFLHNHHIHQKEASPHFNLGLNISPVLPHPDLALISTYTFETDME